jgi:hypothetical protein
MKKPKKPSFLPFIKKKYLELVKKEKSVWGLDEVEKQILKNHKQILSWHGISLEPKRRKK